MRAGTRSVERSRAGEAEGRRLIVPARGQFLRASNPFGGRKQTVQGIGRGGIHADR